GFGNQDWCADIDLWTPGVLGLDFDAARLRLRDRILEHLLVELDTDLLDVAGLLVAEQIACPANVQVVTGESETGAERVQRLHDVQPLLRRLRRHLARRQREIGISPHLAPTDPSP